MEVIKMVNMGIILRFYKKCNLRRIYMISEVFLLICHLKFKLWKHLEQVVLKRLYILCKQLVSNLMIFQEFLYNKFNKKLLWRHWWLWGKDLQSQLNWPEDNNLELILYLQKFKNKLDFKKKPKFIDNKLWQQVGMIQIWCWHIVVELWLVPKILFLGGLVWWQIKIRISSSKLCH